MTYLVTGANGFVGQALCATLRERQLKFKALSRQPVPAALGDEYVVVPSGQLYDLGVDLFGGVDVVVHLVARVHQITDGASRDTRVLDEYMRVNRDLSLHFAEQAHKAGAHRFVFVSSVKVLGESTNGRGPYTEEDQPAPVDAYGISKLAAERALREFGERSGLEIAVVRPPLVYGPGVRANFHRLVTLVKKGVPLPLKSVRNSRSLVGVRNLTDFLVRCGQADAAAGRTFLVSDGQDLSTPDLIARIAAAAGVRDRTVPCSPRLLKWIGELTGRMEEVNRLCGSFQVSIENAQTELGWEPPYSIDQELARTVTAHLPTR